MDKAFGTFTSQTLGETKVGKVDDTNIFYPKNPKTPQKWRTFEDLKTPLRHRGSNQDLELEGLGFFADS